MDYYIRSTGGRIVDLTVAGDPPRTRRSACVPVPRVWMRSPSWDLGWLIGSAAVVPLGLVAVWSGMSADLINLGVTLLVGGPHLFSTYLATYLDPRFRRAHVPFLVATTLLVPAFVWTLGLLDYQVLLSFFIFAASAHVLQQNAYLAGVYRARSRRREPGWSRWIDWGVLGLSFYPIASWKLARGEFYLGDVQVVIPEVARTTAACAAVSVAFAAFVAAWMAKSAWEWRRGTLNAPKTILIAFTGLVAFFIPLAASGDRMELAFQTVNLWHSIQYLGLVWLILQLRREHGQLDSPLLRRLAGPSAWPFYGACIAVTAALLGVVVVLARLDPLGIPFGRYYLLGILSALLIHYVLDAYLFAVSIRPGADASRFPYAGPLRP
ncbi:MAG TPA: hypothetical protein VEJ18_21410 [Planctomycetota bacterium]|nr:hypothetical protein [Planctomycetota bacterium]